MAFHTNLIVQRAAISRALKAEGYSPERIAEALEALDCPDRDDDDEADTPDSWTRQLQSTRACRQTKI